MRESMKPVVNLYKLGRMPYVKALNVQQVLFDKLKQYVTSPCYKLPAKKSSQVDDTSDVSGGQTVLEKSIFGQQQNNEKVGSSLILVEHEPVYTIGIRSKQYNDKYVSQLKEKLDEHKLKADFVETNRGGLITFHGPGQLVAYPIIYLGDFKTTIKDRSVKAYVNLLENTIMDTLAKVGIEGAHTVKEYPGVWLDSGERKIAFIGIACKRYVTMHGISINCDCDLFWFDHIVSCGIEDKLITSVKQEHFFIREQAQNWPTIIDKSKQAISNLEDGSKNILGASINSNYDSESICLSSTRSDIESVSKAFCVSFSQHFDCNLIDVLNSKEA